MFVTIHNTLDTKSLWTSEVIFTSRLWKIRLCCYKLYINKPWFSVAKVHFPELLLLFLKCYFIYPFNFYCLINSLKWYYIIIIIFSNNCVLFHLRYSYCSTKLEKRNENRFWCIWPSGNKNNGESSFIFGQLYMTVLFGKNHGISMKTLLNRIIEFVAFFLYSTRILFVKYAFHTLFYY